MTTTPKRACSVSTDVSIKKQNLHVKSGEKLMDQYENRHVIWNQKANDRIKNSAATRLVTEQNPPHHGQPTSPH